MMNFDRSNSKTITPNTCCCCFSGETGILIIGWVGVVSDVIGILSHLITGYSSKVPLKNALRIAITVSLILGLFINTLLILGVKKGRALYLAPWICVHVSGLVTILPIVFALLAFPVLTMGDIAIGVIVLLLIFFLIFHFLHVVWVHYESLRREEFELLYNVRDPPNDTVYSPTAPSAV